MRSGSAWVRLNRDPDDARDAKLHDDVGPRLPGCSLSADHVRWRREKARDAAERTAMFYASSALAERRTGDDHAAAINEMLAEIVAGDAGRLK